MSSIDFTSFLKLMAHKKASDLFITAGVPPSIKVQGKVSAITQSPLTPQQSREMVLNVMSPSQREEFEKTHECNFAIGAAGIDIAEDTHHLLFGDDRTELGVGAQRISRLQRRGMGHDLLK